MSEREPVDPATAERKDFVRQAIDEDLAAGRYERVATRFPPEPNGYLHIGHAKAICLNFGVAADYEGTINLRLDDTNPVKEDTEYVDAIKRDISWLGFQWDEELYASDYFETLYGYAETLIEKGLAYVDSLSAEEQREYRGTLTKPGKDSPHRSRSPEENLDLFRKMRAGEFPDGAHVLRAKIDMASPNLNMRDPTMYRIRRAHHHRTGDAWCIYPMYDWAHGQSDSIEGITHSLCSLEFENHRPLYEWFVEKLEIHAPRQIEFARLNLTYTMMSKRKLKELVDEGVVAGWDDPRMPTLAGLRRRGYTPEAIRAFCQRIGVAKYNSTIDRKLLVHVLRDDLNRRALRAMVVHDPLKVVITNYPEGESEEFDAVNNPEDEGAGKRKVPFSRELWIEKEDFAEEKPNKKWKRLYTGGEVRLRYACLLKCEEAIKDEQGEVVELRCTWDPESRGGKSPDGRKVKGTIHWVSAAHAVPLEVRLYDTLFSTEDPDEGKDEGRDWRSNLNPKSLTTITALCEPSLAEAAPGTHFQFERKAYYCVDSVDGEPGKPVFNRTEELRDSFTPPAGGGAKGGGAKGGAAKSKGKGAKEGGRRRRRGKEAKEGEGGGD
ncbi:MAG TPA: glutamine--tRNA ligase [Planctomycetes bacterium]|nr:glutamine--tRNA ligase [Planctomycetota bacterium]